MQACHLTFTKSAIEHLQKMLAQKGEGAYFRLSVKQTGCSGYMYVPSVVLTPTDKDIVLENVEIPTLIDSTWTSVLNGVTVDYVSHRLGQQQLSFQNPNAEGACGCGESFHLKEK